LSSYGSDTLERVYDPLWANARTLLDYLKEQGMLLRVLQGARIGQFVLASGSLVILDLSLLKDAWGQPTVKRLISQPQAQTIQSQLPNPANREQRRRQEALQQKTKPSDDVQFMLEFLPLLPHTIQAHLIGTGFGVWCTLNPKSLVGAASDLLLKHGTYVPGTWNMLGVLDAFPDMGVTLAGPTGLSEIEETIAAVASTEVGKLAARLAPAARRFLGRPPGSYGMTPLLIFRKVSH
jgi:hypothetical protein